MSDLFQYSSLAIRWDNMATTLFQSRPDTGCESHDRDHVAKVCLLTINTHNLKNFYYAISFIQVKHSNCVLTLPLFHP